MLVPTLRRARAAVSAFALLALCALAAACGTADDPRADLPPPPQVPASTTPTGPQDAEAPEDGQGNKDGDDDDDDDDDGGGGNGGGGGGGNGSGGGGGDDDDDGGGSDEPDRPVGPELTRTVTLREVDGKARFSPDGFALPPSRLTLVMRNETDEEHGIAVGGDDVVRESDAVGPGEEARVTIELPAGDYDVFCPVDDHRLENPTETAFLSVGLVPTSIGLLDRSAR